MRGSCNVAYVERKLGSPLPHLTTLRKHKNRIFLVSLLSPKKAWKPQEKGGVVGLLNGLLV